MMALILLLAQVERPPWPKPPSSVQVTLVPQEGKGVVSFGLPFPPDALQDDRMINVGDLPVYTQPLAHWWIDGKKRGIRSVLVQFEMPAAQRVTVTWDKPRQRSRPMTPLADTRVVRKDDGFDFHRPKVLAILPAEWLCGSLVAWQQVPASQNKSAPWFDRHLVDQFPGSIQNLASKATEAHLYDRPATYAKIYVRYGKEKYLLAALRANDFYVQNLQPDGFFALKKGDHKYVYSEGSTLMYLLTGDERYKAAAMLALKSWDQWKRIEYKGQGFWTERHAGTGLAAYLHAYELTGDPAHLATARRYFEAVHALQVSPLDGKEPDGAWLHTGESHGDGNGWTTSPWMSALLMDGIWKLWMLTGDARCPKSLSMYADFVNKYAVTPDRKGVYYMANSPGRGKSENPESPPHNMEACYILAMGYYLSGGADEGMMDTIQSLWPPLMRDQANRPARKFNWRFRETSMLVWFLRNAGRRMGLREINPPPAGDRTYAIVKALLIDGRGGEPVRDTAVIVRSGRIESVGPNVQVPEGSEVVDASGLALIPGLIDAHFHIERDYDLPGLFLSRGVTSLRDPGQWIHVYDPVKARKDPQPRCFVTGPHLDRAPPAHPKDSFLVESEEETRRAVHGFIDEGASAIKVYFRLPPEWIRAACDAAHGRGVPVTAHLEIVDADQAIQAGVDGIEHVTSFGTVLADPADAERFRKAVAADNRARGKGRYDLWSKVDLGAVDRVKPLLELLAARKTYVCPTLAVFERRGEGPEAQGFANMLKFTGMCHKAGALISVGSHSMAPKAERGWAYHREMELLVEAGLTPLEALTAATVNNAKFFRIEDKLGSIEPEKEADLVLVEGDPSKDIGTLRRIRRVMLNGRWVK